MYIVISESRPGLKGRLSSRPAVSLNTPPVRPLTSIAQSAEADCGWYFFPYFVIRGFPLTVMSESDR